MKLLRLNKAKIYPMGVDAHEDGEKQKIFKKRNRGINILADQSCNTRASPGSNMIDGKKNGKQSQKKKKKRQRSGDSINHQRRHQVCTPQL